MAMSGMLWDVLTCPYCGAQVPLGIMSLIARCDCGAWYNAVGHQEPEHGWHKELDEVIG